MKVLHVVYQSLPNISGSSIRTRDIVMSQKEIGLTPIIVSSPFQNGVSNERVEYINRVKHYRTYNNNPDHLVSEERSSLIKRLKKALSIFSFYKEVNKIVREEKPNVLHAHATFFCGIVAVLIGAKNNIPVIYEIRSLWEEREKKFAKSIIERIQPKLITWLETFVMKRANLVVAINKNLEENLRSRSVRNIAVVANAVNTSLIEPQEISSSDKISFGYIGSISPIEGLDLLLEVWNELEAQGYEHELHIYGTGSYFEQLSAMKEDLSLVSVKLHGAIAPSEVKYAFSKIDCIVNPRLKSKITDTVTPLKPLEAMAYGKLVLASDVGGMKELITDEMTGLFFKADSKEDLKRALIDIINQGLNSDIISNGTLFVNEKKSWLANAKQYKSIYSSFFVEAL